MQTESSQHTEAVAFCHNVLRTCCRLQHSIYSAMPQRHASTQAWWLFIMLLEVGLYYVKMLLGIDYASKLFLDMLQHQWSHETEVGLSSKPRVTVHARAAASHCLICWSLLLSAHAYDISWFAAPGCANLNMKGCFLSPPLLRTLPCPALPCPALPCPALPCPALYI